MPLQYLVARSRVGETRRMLWHHLMALALLPSPRLPTCGPVATAEQVNNCCFRSFPQFSSRISIVMMRGGRGGSRSGRGGGRGGGRARSRGGGGRGRPTSSPTPKPGVGDKVSVVEKANYGTDLRTIGVVSRVLTRAAQHPALQAGHFGRPEGEWWQA